MYSDATHHCIYSQSWSPDGRFEKKHKTQQYEHKLIKNLERQNNMNHRLQYICIIKQDKYNGLTYLYSYFLR